MIAASPSPEDCPGIGSAEIVAEFSWLNCSTFEAIEPVSIFTTEDSGTISPLAARTK